MEANLGQRRRGLEEKIPDLKNTLAVVEMLQQRKVRVCCCGFTSVLTEIPAFLIHRRTQT